MQYLFLCAAFVLSLGAGWVNAQPAPSAGCSTPRPPGLQTGRGQLEVAGQPRDFIVSFPEPYDPSTPHALVLAFHGRTSPAAEVQSYYDLEPHAQDTLGPTIFVYPVALTQADGTFSWWDTGDDPAALRDFALFDALLEHFSAAACLDERRIFAVGHSLGGSFVNALGCHRAVVLKARVLRAVASLGAGPGGGACTGSVAALVLHNPDDELVPFSYGLAARDQYLAQNGLSGPPTAGAPHSLAQSLNCERYGAANIPTPVVWCPHTQDYTYGGRYYPHQWPAEAGAAVMRFLGAFR